MKNKVFLDLHVVQTVPASCVNRDDTGSPKTMVYGGKTRGRVSSQCWKHAMREMFKNESPDMCGIRSMWFTQVIRDYLLKNKDGITAEIAYEMSVLPLSLIFGVSTEMEEVKDDKGNKSFVIDYDKSKMNALTFLSQDQITSIGNCILENWDGLVEAVTDYKQKLAKAKAKKDANAVKFQVDKDLAKVLKKSADGNISADMALFGRMVAQSADLSVDACCSVAHAFSTHEVVTEFDYYTATDDYQPNGVTGAANLGSLEFCSMTMYRYATVDVTDLVEKIGVDSPLVLDEFIKAFVMSMPTGKLHSYGNHTLPEYVEISLRHDTPINFAPAFENAVKGVNGMMADSIEALQTYRDNLYAMYEEPDKAWTLNMAQPTCKFADVLAEMKGFMNEYVEEV